MTVMRGNMGEVTVGLRGGARVPHFLKIVNEIARFGYPNFLKPCKSPQFLISPSVFNGKLRPWRVIRILIVLKIIIRARKNSFYNYCLEGSEF